MREREKIEEKISAPENYFMIRKKPFTGFWSRSATLNNNE